MYHRSSWNFSSQENGVSPVDPRLAGDAGGNVVPPGLLRAVAVEVLNQQRPRADQAHLAPQQVQQFRQLVEAAVAQQPAQPRQALDVRTMPAPGRPGGRASCGT